MEDVGQNASSGAEVSDKASPAEDVSRMEKLVEKELSVMENSLADIVEMKKMELGIVGKEHGATPDDGRSPQQYDTNANQMAIELEKTESPSNRHVDVVGAAAVTATNATAAPTKALSIGSMSLPSRASASTWWKVVDATTRWGVDADLYTCHDKGTGPDDLCIPMSSMALDSNTVFRLACYSLEQERWSDEWGRDIFVRGLTDIHHAFTPRGTIANYDGIECSFNEDFSDSVTGRTCLANEDDGHTYWQGAVHSWGWGFMHGQLLRHCDGEYCDPFCPARVYIKNSTAPATTTSTTITPAATTTTVTTASSFPPAARYWQVSTMV